MNLVGDLPLSLILTLNPNPNPNPNSNPNPSAKRPHLAGWGVTANPKLNLPKPNPPNLLSRERAARVTYP